MHDGQEHIKTLEAFEIRNCSEEEHRIVRQQGSYSFTHANGSVCPNMRKMAARELKDWRDYE